MDNISFAEYIESVQFLADNRINFKFPNSSEKHAAVVLANILRISNKVYIYDDNLKGDIAFAHPLFEEELMNFCKDKSKELTLIVGTIQGEDQRLLKFLKKLQNSEKPKIFTYSDAFVNEMNNITTKLNFHERTNFAVGNKTSYRIETKGGRYDYEAECNLNNPEIAEQLRKAIEKNLSNCEEITY